jgi:hypothetical protein
MSTPTATQDDTVVESLAWHWSDLELCEALYWLRRARRRDDRSMVRIWTDRLDALLDWRLEHGIETLV